MRNRRRHRPGACDLERSLFTCRLFRANPNDNTISYCSQETTLGPTPLRQEGEADYRANLYHIRHKHSLNQPEDNHLAAAGWPTGRVATRCNTPPYKKPPIPDHNLNETRTITHQNRFISPHSSLSIYLGVIFCIVIITNHSLINCERLFRQHQSTAFHLPVNFNQRQPTSTAQTLRSPANVPDLIAQQGGIIKDKNITLTKQYNPIVITSNIVIKRDAKLTIESGTELLFEKQKGIIVYGTLEILGHSNDKVKLNLLRSQQSATLNLRSQINNQQLQQQVRLVDGERPSEGRVQIKFNDKWHSLCTNSKNLTALDIKVICRQAGYQEGAFSKWYPRRNGTHFQVMSKSFHCSGNEAALIQCRRWNRIRSGGGVCDFNSDLGVRCSQKLIPSQNDLINSRPLSPDYEYWRGIEFINSDSHQEYVLSGQMKQKISKSRLNHLSISSAGLDDIGNATAAIRVYGQPPRLNHIEIKNSVYGIMIEDADDAISMSDIRLTNNMGYPLFVNTSWGKVNLDRMHVENNGGDGIRIVRHEKIVVGSHDFCKFANLGSSQSYPVVLSHEQRFLATGNDCCQEFVSNNQLTAHFPVLRSTPNNLIPESEGDKLITVPKGVQLGRDANLVIYDDYRDEFPFKIRVRNETRAQSIVSRTGRLKICYESASYRTVLFTVQVVADTNDDETEVEERGTGIARDVEISNSYIRRNEGRGIWVDNQRSGVRIINTTVIHHNYLSGMHLENGTGEVIIQGSEISNNTGHGLYITLAGGYYHIDNSTISGNTLSGITIEYDKRPELVPLNHTMHIGYSLIAHNGEHGLFIGNVCRSDAFWNISMNSFIKNNEDAISFQSCLPTHENVLKFTNQTSRIMTSEQDNVWHSIYQNVFITHNVFLENNRRAIKIAPVFFVKSFIRHNLFKDQPLAVIYINNQAFEDILNNSTALAPVNIRISSNRFYTNRGRYVANIGVQEESSKQAVMFTKNYLEDNQVNEPYADLQPRSRVSAVVVVSSTNTKVLRNRFDNPRSNFEMGTHLEAHAKIINATANYWGPGLDASSIYRRIFDRKNRYNLAQIEFLQYLMSPEDLEYMTDLSFERERDKITTFRNGTRLGGEIKGFEELRPETYIVQDDLFIRPGGHLLLRPGTTFKFHDGVGMMVQGRLDALGSTNSPIHFTSAQSSVRVPSRPVLTTTTTLSPYFNPWVSHQPDIPSSEDYEHLVNFSLPGSHRLKRQTGSTSSTANVRLSHTTMGRLEVQIDGAWGSVCDYNFDIDDAAVVCQQLGMILNKDDWLLERYQYAANDQQQLAMMSADALMTNVRCDPTLDTDITGCKAEISSRGDFDSICNSEVGIRCFPPSWSGVRLGMGAEISTLKNVVIQRAGMFDYSSYTLRPALQIDFNKHHLNSLIVKSNSDSGLGVKHNDVIGRHFHELAIIDSKFTNNERHGIELKSRGLSIKGSTMSNNRQNGLDYSASFNQKEIDDLLSWLHTAKNADKVVSISFPAGMSKHYQVPSSEDSYRFFIIPRDTPPEIKESFTIGTDPGHMLSMQIINPINPESTEVLNMSLGLNPESPIWDLRVNTTSFPMVSPGYKFHFNYTSGSDPKGNTVLYIRSRYNNRDLKVLTKFIPPHLVMPKFDLTASNINSQLINSLVISNCTIVKNGIGLKFRHPNYQHGPRFVFNQRYSNETTNITNNVFDGNYFSAIYVGSDEHDIIPEGLNKFEIPTADIRYHVIGNKMRRNKDGIRQFCRDIRYSQNVFHWSINDTLFEQNKAGGINIVLPYFWKYDTNLSHTVEISNNSFSRNSNFELSIEGHFVMLNITSNSLRENRCRNRLIGFSGMEKRLFFEHNIIEYNICNRVIDFHINSHADKMGSMPTMLRFNALRYNRRMISNSTYSSLIANFRYPRLLPKLHPLATDYALAIRGIQALNITRNLFLNPDLRYELVVAIIIDPDERTVNAVENFWGSRSMNEISERIFDFDDWNSYAVADLSPILLTDSFQAATMVGEPSQLYQPITSRSIGGRMVKSTVLPYRKEPYIVESDLTVMPDVQLVIEAGVTLEFMPNVGILVLGDLIASGLANKPIQMRPVLAASDVMYMSSYLLPTKSRPNLTQAAITDPLAHEHNYAFKHYAHSYSIDMGSVRLCKNEICNDGSHIYENNVEDPILRQEVLDGSNNTWKMDGFLEIFNMTTLQWVPVCDPLFTEHSAAVVCRQLGYTHLSLFKRGRRYTIEQEQVSSVRYWPDSVQCEGDESNLSSCPLAATGFMNHSTSCTREGNQFVYVHCEDFPENPSSGISTNHSVSNEHLHHWGGIRFSCPSKSSTALPGTSYSDRGYRIAFPKESVRSLLRYVSIDRAGLLHRKKAPAVQVLQCKVNLEYLAVTNSAHHGVELITSNANQNFHQLRIKNNLGIGVNYISLTGSSSATKLVPYLPLKRLDFSSDIFGLVDICVANKEIKIEERMLLFYRYTSRPVDCIKIITSKLGVKHLGLRMLQFDLFNSSSLTARPDHVRIYDGNVFDRDSRLIADLGVEEKHRAEKPELKFYQSTDSTMTIRLHASAGGLYQGFIAEVVTTPISYSIQRDLYSNFTLSEITGNKQGGLSVSSAGESMPNIIMKHIRLESNCLHLFGNFTSCLGAVFMELQNCQRLRMFSNLIKNNQGGVVVKSYSHSAVSALDAILEKNVFESNFNTHTLAVMGPKTDPYQRVNVIDNFFTRNVARYLSNIVLSRIVANFSSNIISGNVGKHQIEVVGFDKLPLSYQTFQSNWIYNNTATFERDQSTISGNSAGQYYRENYLVNPDNHFELSTKNWSRYDVKPLHVARDDEIIHLVSGDGSTKEIMRKTVDSIPLNIIDAKRVDLYQATIDAKRNWWGFNSTAAIQGRIRGRMQHEELIKVDFTPFLETNRTILSGICSGGWKRVDGACLLYVGTRMTYHEARDFCERERATMPLLRGFLFHYEFTDFVASEDPDFDSKVDRLWVRSFEGSRDACPALNDYRTKHYDCQDRNAFLCEKDPQVVVSLGHWYRQRGGLIALILALTTIILTCCCSACWFYKSKHRHKEKLVRRNSLHASMRSLRGQTLSNNSLNEVFLHSQFYKSSEKSSASDLSLSSTQWTQPSYEDANLVRLDPAANSASANMRHHYANNVRKHKPVQPQQSTYSPNLRAKNFNDQHSYGQQDAFNPTYVSPVPPSRQSSKDNVSYTNLPSPERQRKPQKVLSRAPSYPGSFVNDVITDPMPDQKPRHKKRLASPMSSQGSIGGSSQRDMNTFKPVMSSTPDYDYQFQPPPPLIEPPPQLSYQYSNIRVNADTDDGVNIPYDFNDSARHTSSQAQDYIYNQHQGSDHLRPVMQEVDESGSSVPTFYNNHNESFDEESTNSYLETYNAYNEAYKSVLQPVKGDEISIILTEQSSITDSIVNERIILRQTDLISMLPQGVADPGSKFTSEYTSNDTNQNNFHTSLSSGNLVGSNATASTSYLNKASSDVGSSKSNRFNLMETSFDLDAQTQPVALSSNFGGSQRLSPASSMLSPTDSKLGSRVYLETSFE